MTFTQIDCFFSFRAVASYIVGRQITALARASKLQVRFFPIDLTADQPHDLISLPGSDAAPLSVIKEPTNRTVPINLPAGMIIASQARNLASDQLTDAILAALWRDNHDISDPTVMVPLADKLGMDGALLMCEALEADTQATLAEHQQYAAHIGIQVTPSYTFGDEVFTGNDGLNRLRQRLMRR